MQHTIHSVHSFAHPLHHSSHSKKMVQQSLLFAPTRMMYAHNILRIQQRLSRLSNVCIPIHVSSPRLLRSLQQRSFPPARTSKHTKTLTIIRCSSSISNTLPQLLLRSNDILPYAVVATTALALCVPSCIVHTHTRAHLHIPTCTRTSPRSTLRSHAAPHPHPPIQNGTLHLCMVCPKILCLCAWLFDVCRGRQPTSTSIHRRLPAPSQRCGW